MVFDDDNRKLLLLLNLQQGIDQLADFLGVEACRRLIEQEKFGFAIRALASSSLLWSP